MVMDIKCYASQSHFHPLVIFINMIFYSLSLLYDVYNEVYKYMK